MPCTPRPGPGRAAPPPSRPDPPGPGHRTRERPAAATPSPVPHPERSPQGRAEAGGGTLMPAITWRNSSCRDRAENDLPKFVGGYRLSGVPRLASAWHRLRECQARSTCMSEHPAATAPAAARGNDMSFRPGQPAYRGQFWAPASAAARGRGPDASLPGPGAVPHPPLVRVPYPSRCPRPGPGGMRYMARHQTIARLPTPGPPGRGHDTGAGFTCAFTAMARI